MMGVAMELADEDWHKQAKIIAELREQVTSLQTRMSEIVMERQQKNRYGGRRRRQHIVLAWATRLFGTNTQKLSERVMRVVEETIEVAQAAGVPVNVIERIVYRVYSKAPGELVAETGGMLVTGLALCEILGVDGDELERDEMERVMSLPEHICRESHERKVRLGIAEPSNP